MSRVIAMALEVEPLRKRRKANGDDSDSDDADKDEVVDVSTHHYTLQNTSHYITGGAACADRSRAQEEAHIRRVCGL